VEHIRGNLCYGCPLAFQTLSDIWTDTLDELYDFMEHVNSLYENIQVELQRIKLLGTLVINSSELYLKTLHKHACINLEYVITNGTLLLFLFFILKL
jgi:hypothetical protein